MDASSTTPLMPTDGPRSVNADRGVAWWSDAWALFMKQPGMWLVLGLLFIVAFGLLSFIPVLGQLLLPLALPGLVGGWVLATRKVQGGGTLEPGDILLGFKEPVMTPLLVLGGVALAAGVAMTAVMWMFGVGSVIGMAMGGAMGSTGGVLAALGMGAVGLLLVLALSVPVAMAFWFAPSLVVVRGTAPIEALKLSFQACLRNIVPMLLYGIIYFVASVVASVPAMLGWLLLVPVSLLTLWTSYRDVFGD